MCKFMDCLPDFWESICTCIKTSKDLENMPLTALYGTLHNYEQTKILKKALLKDPRTTSPVALLCNDTRKPVNEPRITYLTDTEDDAIRKEELVESHADDADDKGDEPSVNDLADNMAMMATNFKRYAKKGSSNFSPRSKVIDRRTLDQPKSAPLDLSNEECFKCDKKGHFAAECKSKRISKCHPFHPSSRSSHDKYKAKYKREKAKNQSLQRKGKGLMVETQDWIDEPTYSSSDENMTHLCLMTNIQEIEDSVKGSSSTVVTDLPSTSKDAKDLVKPKKVNNFSSLSESEKVQPYDSLSVDLYNARSAKKKADLEIKSLTSQLHKCYDDLDLCAPDDSICISSHILSSSSPSHLSDSVGSLSPRSNDNGKSLKFGIFVKANNPNSESENVPVDCVFNFLSLKESPEACPSKSKIFEHLKHPLNHRFSAAEKGKSVDKPIKNKKPKSKLKIKHKPSATSSQSVVAPQTGTSGLGHRQIWYLDSGCSRHMTGNKSLLINYVSEPGSSVTFGDNARGTTKEYGVLSNGSVTFNRVAYVDGLKHNLLSISQLCDLNFIVKFEENQCTILDSSGKKVLTGIRKDNVYVINMDSSSSSDANICSYSEATADQNWLWHKRLSHLNFKAINNVSSKDLVIGLPNMSYVKVKLCAACEKGKQTKASFKSKMCSFIFAPLHMLHMDLCGPVSVQSLGGKCYTLVIVDEDQLGKFDPKSDEGIFVGYSLFSKAYRVYNMRRQCIDESINVRFDESKSMPASSSFQSDDLELNKWLESHSSENSTPVGGPPHSNGDVPPVEEDENEDLLFNMNIPSVSPEQEQPIRHLFPMWNPQLVSMFLLLLLGTSVTQPQ
ncbi:uncharacterized protein LOC112509039 [Cynara cardunculus var. scolymus]|uniref:uncharacterized protein LOC112509039 n=1 Tax=Cynara cardunculus var. scolymus TaxID=59895 RepID=UPI000D62DFC9|nr:uncharacterized protein LOC112509039 [Cynara cardunculus var. scolymus]